MFRNIYCISWIGTNIRNDVGVQSNVGEHLWQMIWPHKCACWKSFQEADLWASATWYAKSLTIGFEASLHKKLHKCPADVSLTCWWHSVYGWYLQFHETSTPRSGPDRGQIKFRLTATSHLPPIYFYVFVGKNSSATKWRGCPPFVVTADLKMFLWMRASCPLVSKLIDLPDSATV